MRLSEMRPRRNDEPLPDEVRADLEALDAALRGEQPAPGRETLGFLASELRDERPEADPAFAAALDEWAASGFARGSKPPGLEAAAGGGDDSGARGLFAELMSFPPRRILAPMGAAVTAIVVVAVAISVDGDGQDESSGGGGEAGVPALSSGDADEAVAEQDAAQPEVEPTGGGLPGALLQGGAAAGGLDARSALDAGRAKSVPFIRNDSNSGYAGGQDVRRVERDAQLTLAAPADEVQEVTNNAIDVVEGYRGIVLLSQSSGSDESASATLRVVIPTRTLDTALDDLSDLADVKSLSEGSVDITKPFVDAKDRLAGLRAERKSVIAQIKVADTEEELDNLKVRLAGVQNEVARAEAEFDNIQNRAQLSNVTVQITSSGASEGDWSIDDALDDAGRVLTVGAGIALISGAVLLPLALIGAIFYFAVTATRRRARERALDE